VGLAAVIVAVAGFCAGSASFAADNDKDKSQGGDQKFVKVATDANLAEINHGNLASQQAADPEVRAFGQRMVTDHSMANQQLLMLADRKKIRVPQEMGEEHKKMQEKLTKLQGAKFDREYITHMVHGHKEAVSLFETESKEGKDADLKAFAAKTLPIIKDHLKMAEKIADRINKDSGSKS